MARPATRSKNLDQHPGQILLDAKQKRRTTEQKQADDARAEQARQEEAAARHRGMQRLANIITRTEKEEMELLTQPCKPRSKANIATEAPIDSAKKTADSMVIDGMLEEDNGQEESDECDTDDANDNEKEIPTQTVSRRRRTQKTSTRDAVDAVCDKEVGKNEGTDSKNEGTDSQKQRVDGQPEKNLASIQVAKKGVAGLGDEEEWAERVASANFKTLLSQRPSTSSSRHTRSISSAVTSSHFKGLQPTPASVSSGTHPSSPLTDLSTTELVWDVEDDEPYIKGGDQIERATIPSVSKSLVHQSNITDITEVVATSEPDEVTPPPTTRPHTKKDNSTKGGRKRAQQSEVDTQSAALPSKRTKTSQPDKDSTSKWSGGGAKKKYVKGDLPSGCTDDNIWRRKFISALAHFASSYDNPWTIPTEKLLSVLQEIWGVVYAKKIEHTVTTNGAVFQLAKQSLNVWRSGFASAAISVITTFFANSKGFEDQSQRIAFAKAMLKRNCFLYEKNKGVDSMAWSGMWRAPIVLQTFAHHFNYIHGRAEVPALEGDLDGPRTVLALAGAALCRVLTLVSEDYITFEMSTSKNGEVWSAVVHKGSQYEFNETVWGTTMRRYLDPIKKIPSEKFALILEEAQEHVRKSTMSSAAGNATADSGDDSEFEELFAYR